MVASLPYIIVYVSLSIECTRFQTRVPFKGTGGLRLRNGLTRRAQFKVIINYTSATGELGEATLNVIFPFS